MTDADSDASRGGGTRYDRQLIVALTGGDGGTTSAQAEALGRKLREPPLPSEVVTVHRETASARSNDVAELRGALAGERDVPLPVGGRSRLYLVGKGNAAERTLAGWTPAAVATLLADAGLRELALLSIVADGAGRDPDRDAAGQTDAEAKSFASLLHRALRDEHDIVTTVNARVGAVRVLAEPTESEGAVVDAGRKLTAPDTGGEGGKHHAPHSKLQFRWDGGRQLREWSY